MKKAILFTLLLSFVPAKQFAMEREALQERVIDQKTLDDNLRQAVKRNRKNEVAELLAQGANPNAPDDYSLSVLCFATCPEIAQLLINNHAEVNRLVDCVLMPRDVLYFIIDHQRTSIAKVLLSNGAYINSTSLDWAFQKQNQDIIRLLLSALKERYALPNVEKSQLARLSNPHNAVHFVHSSDVIERLRYELKKSLQEKQKECSKQEAKKIVEKYDPTLWERYFSDEHDNNQ